MHVNLLPSSFVWRRLVRKRIRQWSWVFGLAALLLLALNLRLLGQWWNGRCEIQAMQAAAEPVRNLQAENIQLAKSTHAIHQKLKQLKLAVLPDRSTSLLGILSKGVASARGSLQIQEVQVSFVSQPSDSSGVEGSTPGQSNPRTNRTTETAPPVNQYQVMLRGIATEGESISTFMDSLQESCVFPKLELRSTQERTVSERSIQEFHVECVAND